MFWNIFKQKPKPPLTPYEDGWATFRTSKPCPYPEGSPEAVQFYKGRDEAIKGDVW